MGRRRGGGDGNSPGRDGIARTRRNRDGQHALHGCERGLLSQECRRRALLPVPRRAAERELVSAFEALLRADADYVQGSRWLPGGKVVGSTGGRGFGTRIYSIAFSLLVGRRVSDATNGFRILRSSLLDDPRINLDQTWLTSYDLEPYVLFKAIRGGYRVIEHPVTVVYHATEGYTKMRGVKDWWRLFRPALLLRTGVKR